MTSWLFEIFFEKLLFDFLREKWLLDFLSVFSKRYFLTFLREKWLFDFLREKWLFDFLSFFLKSYFLTFCAKSDFLSFWVVFRKVTFWLFARKVTFWLFEFFFEKLLFDFLREKLLFDFLTFCAKSAYSRSKAFLRRERRLAYMHTCHTYIHVTHTYITLHYITIQYITVQYSTVHYSTVHTLWALCSHSSIHFSLIHEHILTCLYVNILSCVKWSSSNAKSKAAPGKLSKAISKISAIPGPNLNLLSIQWQRATGVFLKQHARGNLRRHGDFFNMKTGSRLGRKHPESWQHRGGKMVLKTDLARKSSSASATWLKLCFWYQVLLIVGGSCWKLQKWGIETAEQCFAFTVLAKISWGCWKGGGQKYLVDVVCLFGWQSHAQFGLIVGRVVL